MVGPIASQATVAHIRCEKAGVDYIGREGVNDRFCPRSLIPVQETVDSDTPHNYSLLKPGSRLMQEITKTKSDKHIPGEASAEFKVYQCL